MERENEKLELQRIENAKNAKKNINCQNVNLGYTSCLFYLTAPSRQAKDEEELDAYLEM